MAKSSKKPSSAGKGDKNRIGNYRQYGQNYDEIDWKKPNQKDSTIKCTSDQ